MMEDLEFEKMQQDVQEKRIQNFTNFMGLMTSINPNWMQSEVRFRLQTEDMIKNIISPTPILAIANDPAVPAITNGPIPNTTASISVSQIAQELGKRLNHGQLIRAGGVVARKYRELYGADPAKHSQWVDGAERKVNSYTERDRGLVVEALRELEIV